MERTTRNVPKTMAKLDFSSLKTADLRSVAPVDESAIPRAQSASETESPVSASAPETSVPVFAAPAQATPAASVPAPAASAAKPASPAVHAAKKISLTGLKSGKSSAVSSPAPVHAVQEESPAPAASAAKPASPAVHAAKKISLGSKPTISLGTKKAEASSVPVEAVASTEAAEAPSAEAQESERPLVEGVDIIEAAKVIGTEGEAKANEILTESLKDPEVAKKEAEEKAVAAVVIPESEKEFFPNLEMDDDFFKDPLFEGIVPPKPEKKPEVRQPLEMKKEESETPAAAEAVTEEAPAEAVAEAISAAEEIPAEAVVAESQEAPLSESETPVETVITESSAVQEAVAETVAEIPSETPVENPASEAAYVETVAKDLSAERKGGLAKLFWERKVLVRAMAGFFALAVVGVGAFSFVSPSIKTSGPEAVPTATGSEVRTPDLKNVPEGGAKVLGEGIRVFTVRRPNAPRHKNLVPATGSWMPAAVGPQSEAMSGSAMVSGDQAAQSLTGSVVQSAGSGAATEAATHSGTESASGAAQAPGAPASPVQPSDPEVRPAEVPTAVPQPPVPQTK